MKDGSELHSIVQAIADHLRCNPGACDSAEGIRRWWLDEAQDVSAEDLHGALQWMKEHVLIEEQVALDGRSRFRRAA